MATEFTLTDNWIGSSYEFVIILRPPSNQKLYSCIKRLWTHPTLEGVYSVLAKTQPQSKISFSSLSYDQFHSWDSYLGLATLPNHKRMVCFSSTYHADDEDKIKNPYPYEMDYLFFTLPIGALGKCLDIGAYPFDESVIHQWTQSLDVWFFQICEYVFEEVPFYMTEIGGDCSPDFLISPNFIEKNGIPEQRYMSLAIPKKNKLIYYPAMDVN